MSGRTGQPVLPLHHTALHCPLQSQSASWPARARCKPSEGYDCCAAAIASLPSAPIALVGVADEVLSVHCFCSLDGVRGEAVRLRGAMMLVWMGLGLLRRLGLRGADVAASMDWERTCLVGLALSSEMERSIGLPRGEGRGRVVVDDDVWDCSCLSVGLEGAASGPSTSIASGTSMLSSSLPPTAVLPSNPEPSTLSIPMTATLSRRASSSSSLSSSELSPLPSSSLLGGRTLSLGTGPVVTARLSLGCCGFGCGFADCSLTSSALTGSDMARQLRCSGLQGCLSWLAGAVFVLPIKPSGGGRNCCGDPDLKECVMLGRAGRCGRVAVLGLFVRPSPVVKRGSGKGRLVSLDDDCRLAVGRRGDAGD